MSAAAASRALRPADAGANVVLAEAADDTVFEGIVRREGLWYAAPTQVAADLLTSPGRGPQEGEGLIDWMKDNEDRWQDPERYRAHTWLVASFDLRIHGGKMDDRRIPIIYQDYVVAHDLERTALLEAIRARCPREANVLYPGSSVHVTPSFFFQHVVYVDRTPMSRDFFARAQAVLDLVNARKRYRQQPFIRFIQQDFTADLPLPEGSFDLLLALYAGGVSRACARYVKPGGLVLTNDHHGDAREAAELPGLELQAVIHERRGNLRFEDADLERHLGRANPDRPSRRGAAKPAYYLFRRLRQRT